MKSSNEDKEKDISSTFKRTEVIGRGKFGIVYKGYHVKTKQVYAIKVLNLDSSEDEVEDVQREIQFLASLKQIPNITRYYGSYLRGTSLWIIMEYCAGGSLRSLLRPGKIDEKYIGVIMRELLVALKVIHKDNVIHRDIKAANVLITNEGQVKLCDFGVAAQLNQTSLRRQTMAGTPYWMAPEVIMEGVYYDTKVDIWSLGITAYEIATGNPPYCDVEALRAMQLIIKSKPPRLEECNYTPQLKEFIALCLDEDPQERLSAEELLKTKFIKTHKATPTTILKELISRYLLFRDKNKSYKDSAYLADDIPNAKAELTNEEKRRLSSDSSDGKEELSEIDVKWDFDSLSSNDYIIDNNIQMDAIPQDSGPDWPINQVDHFNFAYPEEDQYYMYHTNNNIQKTYQGTTIGKGNVGTIVHNSTLNAPISHTTTQFGNKATGTTSNITGSHSNPSNASKRLETKALKQLLQLFEDNEVISEETDISTELPVLAKNSSSLHIKTNFNGGVSEDTMGSASSEARKYPGVLTGSSYYSQSSPMVPVTSHKYQQGNGPMSSTLTAAPTSIEIEIPEELPTSTSTLQSQETSSGPTKPRSSTVSNPQLSFKQQNGVSRRLTVGAGANRNDNQVQSSLSTLKQNITEDNQKENPKQSSTVNNQSNGQLSSGTKSHHRTPSPSRLFANGSSPNKPLNISPTMSTASHLGGSSAPPMMKPMSNTVDRKDDTPSFSSPMGIVGKPSMNNSPSDGKSGVVLDKNGAAIPFTPLGNNSSRVNGEFRRMNPNLKLQMPLPTNAGARNKLLENSVTTSTPSNLGVNTAAAATAPASTNDSINQFGFNTSVTSALPVSMTPINEKSMDFNAKIKRSHSTSKRKNSLTLDQGVSSANLSASSINIGGGGSSNSSLQVNQENQPQLTPNSVLSDGASMNSGNTGTTITASMNSNSTAVNLNSSNVSASALSVKTVTTQPNSNTVTAAGTPVTGGNPIAITAPNVSAPTATAATANNGSNESVLADLPVMQAPPKQLHMDIFLDRNVYSTTNKMMDKKPQVLYELEKMLKMYEQGFPALEHALKSQLEKITAEDK